MRYLASIALFLMLASLASAQLPTVRNWRAETAGRAGGGVIYTNPLHSVSFPGTLAAATLSTELVLTDNFTMAYWIRETSITTGERWALGGNSAAKGYSRENAFGTDTYYGFVNDGETKSAYFNLTLYAAQLDVWCHRVVVCSNGVISVYHNAAPLSLANAATTSPFVFTLDQVGWAYDTSLRAVDYIDQLVIWRRPLTETEITTLYNSSNGLYHASANFPTGAVFGWEFDEGTSSIVNDFVGSNNGTLSGSAAWVQGKVLGP
jgi:hypothetical protein